MKVWISLCLFFALAITSSGQKIPGEIIVKLKNPTSAERLVEVLGLNEELATLSIGGIVRRALPLVLIEFDHSQMTYDDVADYLNATGQVVWTSPNFALAARDNIPNDERFSEQWDKTRVNVPAFWDVTTGGVSPGGDTIVVADIESDGYNLDHPDILGNVWYNHGEFPDDGIDNDDNGYIDDYQGWNINMETDDHPIGTHGAHITGVIGAKGNNGLGISGMNWDVKIMPLTITGNVLRLLEALQYALDMRTLYNTSQGQKGAYIVAVNKSLGVSDVFPADNPAYGEWCALIDDLGAQGVLCVSAAPNDISVNVDVVGDMPSTCPNESLITVTGINQEDQLEFAKGPEHIDMAAPATDILTIDLLNNYDFGTGTSNATPIVSGAVALMYSYPCDKWANLQKNNPQEAALTAKSWILDNVQHLQSLEANTLTGGILDMERIRQKMEVFCEGNEKEPLAFTITPTITNDELVVAYQTPSFENYELVISDMMGRQIYHKLIQSEEFKYQQETISVQHLPAGLYIIQFGHDDIWVRNKFVIPGR